eukprot:3833994-Rhodomonas_salina.1
MNAHWRCGGGVQGLDWDADGRNRGMELACGIESRVGSGKLRAPSARSCPPCSTRREGQRGYGQEGPGGEERGKARAEKQSHRKDRLGGEGGGGTVREVSTP